MSPVPVISRQTTWKSEVVKLIVNFRRNAYLKLRGGSNSNEVCLATEKMDRKNNTVENISKNFSQTLDSVLTMANITNRQKDSWSLKKSFNDLFYWTYPHFLKLIIQYRPKWIRLLFKMLLWLKHASYRLGNCGIWKSLNCRFRNTPNLLRLLISGLRKLSLKIKVWNLKCEF